MLKRILVFPLPELGHLRPTLNIARHYVEQGMEVVYFSAPQFRSVIELVGARLHPVFVASDPGKEFTGQRLWRDFSSNGWNARRTAIEQVLREYLADNPCDLFLSDLHLSTSYGCNFTASFPRQAYLHFSTSLLKWQSSEVSALSRPVVILCPEDFELPQFRNHGPTAHYAEPSVFEGEKLVGTSVSARPLILAAWGSQSVRYSELHKITPMFIDVARRRPEWDFVVMQFEELTKRSSQEEPPDNLLYRPSLPQVDYLQRASVLCCHGGLGSIKEALLMACPIIATPFMADQPYNAIRVADHGLGSALDPADFSVASLEQHLAKALSGQYQNALDVMHSIFREREATRDSTRLIEAAMR